MSISDTSSEFWDQGEAETKSVAVSADIEFTSEKVYEPDQESLLLTSSPNSYFHNRLQSLLSNLRIGSDIQQEQELSKQARKLSKVFNNQIQELLKKQQNDMLEIKKDYDSLKNLLLNKDEEITRLHRLLIEQEVPITKQRLFKKISRASIIMKNQEKEESSNEWELQVKAMKIQFIGMKELVKDYQEQTEKARNELKTCQQELKRTQSQAEADLKSQQHQSLQEKSELLKKIDELNLKYQIFKEEVKKEMEINSIVIKQQMEINNCLKKELKSAKMVLVTPRLREKFLGKLPTDNTLTNPESRIKKNMKKKDLTHEYLNSTRASPADYSITDFSLQSSSPVVGLLPEISSRYISQ